MMPVCPMGIDVPGMKPIMESSNGKLYTCNYVKSWVSMLVMAEGLKRAKKAGKMNGPGLKAALETIKDFDTKGLTAPITFTPKDHRPNTALSIYSVNKDGDLFKVEDLTFPRLPKYLGY